MLRQRSMEGMGIMSIYGRDPLKKEGNLNSSGRIHHLVCAYCGEKFTAHRQHAKYCSDMCRKRQSRHPALMNDYSQTALRMIDYLKMGRNKSDYTQWRTAMLQIRDEAQRNLDLAEREQEEKIARWNKTMKKT